MAQAERSVPVRAQGHVEQEEQANRHGVEDNASRAGVIGPDRIMVEAADPGLDLGNVD